MARKKKITELSIFWELENLNIEVKGESDLGNDRFLHLSHDEFAKLRYKINNNFTSPSYNDLYEFVTRISSHEPDFPVTVEQIEEEARMIIQDLPF